MMKAVILTLRLLNLKLLKIKINNMLMFSYQLPTTDYFLDKHQLTCKLFCIKINIYYHVIITAQHYNFFLVNCYW